MNEPERTEFERLKQRHARLDQELSLLASQLKRLESRLDSPEPAAAKPPSAAPIPADAPPAPPVIQPRELADVLQAANVSAEPTPPTAEPTIPPIEEPRSIRCLCKHCGGHLEFAISCVGDTIPCPHCKRLTFLVMETRPPAEPTPGTWPSPEPFVPPPIAAAPAAQARVTLEKAPSFEMRLGTYWMVRIGIVMLLTGLVFFGNYAYQNFIINFGPGGKVALLYLTSGILLGAGTWWQRKAVTETLRNYAQVLFAGGLAAVYFTTYAAHYVETLHVIGSQLLDGALLLGWAGFIVWIADRRKSEVLALFAVGLAYYTSVITRVGDFTLYSNLVLTIAAVFFLVRNRWAGLTFASLIATYASYGYWRFFDGSNWHWASPEQGLWHGTSFLMSYWIVFTAAVFLSKHEKFRGPNRATFLTLNNCEFFVMFLLTMLQVRQGGFWKFSLIYGTVLLAMAELARRVLAGEPLAKNSYLTQGLLLVTIGFISKFTGLKLALLLGAESVVLLTLGLARRSFILQLGAYLCGALAVGWGIDGLERDNLRMLCFNTAVGAMMTFNAFWTHRQAKQDPALLRLVPAFFVLLALISWLATTWYNTSPARFPLALAVETLALTLSIYWLRVRELALLGQGYLVIAHGAWLVRFVESEVKPPWWNPALLIAITLGLSHWWQRQKVLAVAAQLKLAWQGALALALVGVLHYWLQPVTDPAVWVALSSLLAIGITVYGVFTRAWLLALCAQILLFVSAARFAGHCFQHRPEWNFPLAPIIVLGLLSGAAVSWFRARPGADAKVRGPLLQLALVYRWVALVMSVCWVQEYVTARERIWVFALLGLGAFVAAGLWKNPEALLFSAGYSAFGLGLFWLPMQAAATVYWPNLLAILALLAQQRVARRLSARYALDERVQGALILLGSLSLWLLLSRWVMELPGKSYLTASWAGLALVLFLFGIVLRERVYRWLGLGILACALVRVGFVDVWKLKELYRILSFVALGIVPLVIGYIYSKYQEKIKEWL